MVDIGGSSQLRLHMLAVVTLNIWQSLTHANFWCHVFSSSSAARARFPFLWDALLMNEAIYNSILSQLILRFLSTKMELGQSHSHTDQLGAIQVPVLEHVA